MVIEMSEKPFKTILDKKTSIPVNWITYVNNDIVSRFLEVSYS